MPRQVSIEEFLNLREQFPLVDVRSPKEFAEGHIKGAINIPVLNDEERSTVGTDYKQKGKDAAIKTALKLVGPRLFNIVEQAGQVAPQKALLVHCWRGGMRSSNFSWLIELSGISCTNLQGGYKAYRQLAVDTYSKNYSFIVITGATGSGKTEIIKALAKLGEQVIDLEALAGHKGSVFGGLGLNAQPSTEQFQNNLFEELYKLDSTKHIWIEDESIAIGHVFLPDTFWRTLRSSLLIEIEVPKETRVQKLVSDYGKAEVEKLEKAIDKIARKLGGQHAKAAKEHLHAGDLRTTADILLTYYDKAYKNGLITRAGKIIGRIGFDGQSAEAIAKQLVQQSKALV